MAAAFSYSNLASSSYRLKQTASIETRLQTRQEPILDPVEDVTVARSCSVDAPSMLERAKTLLTIAVSKQRERRTNGRRSQRVKTGQTINLHQLAEANVKAQSLMV